MFDIAIIGGGFYGCSLALLFADAGKKVCVLERSSEIMTRSSATNQARVHNGYHYPRSLPTAARSHVNFPRFCADFSPAVVSNFKKVYAIAKERSKVNTHQFIKFCKVINSPLRPTSTEVSKLFNPKLIESTFEVDEFAFDYSILREILLEQLDKKKVALRLNFEVSSINPGSTINVLSDTEEQISAKMLLNCTYSHLNSIDQKNGSLSKTPLKHEITEIALVIPPPPFEKIGVTVMDGPFFSVMPFPAQKLHSFTHVKYTPHLQWRDPEQGDLIPYNILEKYPKNSKFRHMLADAHRYIPCLADSQYQHSLFEVKTVLVNNEIDDGRPILFKKHPSCPNIFSILGGKIDNIYDIYQKIEEEGLLK